MKSFAINLLVAVIWLLLSADPSPEVFTIGFLLGFMLLAVFRSVLNSGSYVRRVFATAHFLLLFGWEFLIANVNVVRTVLFRPIASLRPNFVTYDVTDLKPFEILLISYCISLTPGSTTVKVTEDFNTLIMHTLDVDDPEAVRARLDRTFKRRILNITR